MRRAYRQLVARRVIVNLTTDKAFAGVLWSECRDLLVLRDATLLDQGTETAVDGEVVIERSRIDFMQVVS